MNEKPPPGWYHAQSDPTDTERYWDGQRWTADTRPAQLVPGVSTPGGRTFATGGARIAARLIDVFIGLVLSIPISIIGAVSTSVSTEFTQTSAANLIQVLVIAAYEVGFVGLVGATPGKMALRIEVVRQSDEVTPPGLTTALIRWSPIIAAGLIPFVGLLVTVAMLASLVLVFVESRRRSALDFVAQTYVVQRESNP